MQLNIFSAMYPRYKINKPIRLYTLFSGYDSQALALKYLGVKFEHYKTCEWAVNSIQALKDLHFKQDHTDYSAPHTHTHIVEMLANYGISQNYNNPMTIEQIKHKSEIWARTVFNNIQATHNLVDISKAHLKFEGEYCNIVTYSFPCQDLSLAGKGAGMDKGSETRSSLLWQVERILNECDVLPDVLIMENVPMVHSKDNVESFNKWQLELERLGYSNYWQDLNSKDYGVPQNRDRCFMVSILGNWYYEFPQPIKLEKVLKDVLEDEKDVKEKYYLSEELIERIRKWKGFENPLDDINEDRICSTITTHCGKDSNGMQLVEVVGNYSPSGHNATRIVDPEGIAPTVMENHGSDTAIPIKNATKQGYLLAEEGDGIDISTRMESHRGTVQKGMAQTITTAGGDNVGVVVKDTENYIQWEQKGFLDIDCRAYKEDKIAPTTTTPHTKILLNDLRIRKLTPKECFRLMGVRDCDSDNITGSDANKYHLAGDSIVVDVLMAIFKQML